MDPCKALYLQYADVADSVATRYAKSYGRDKAEILDHAQFALTLLIYSGYPKWDPTRSPLRRWLWVKTYWHVREVLIRGKHPHCKDLRESLREQLHADLIQSEDEETSIEESVAAPTPWIQSVIHEVEEEGEAFLRIIADIPDDLFDEVRPRQGRTPEDKQFNLLSYLVDVLDWPIEKAEAAFAQVQAIL